VRSTPAGRSSTIKDGRRYGADRWPGELGAVPPPMIHVVEVIHVATGFSKDLP
jgi:hypothetical protein